MDTTFKINGIEYIRWNHYGIQYEAPKNGVDDLGKEFFEKELEFEIETLNYPEPDGVRFTEESLRYAISRQYGWLREQEIM